ncbi:MAG: 4-hydroxybenzoate octaprenyltransferase [Variovorax sp.]
MHVTGLARYLDLIRWNRPAGWLLLLWPTLAALWLAANGWPGWHLLAVFVLGTILMRSAGCCVNDVADREFDRHVKRTAARPVTSGAVSTRQALTLGAVLAAIAFALALTTNAAVLVWAVVGLVVTCFYPYAKRFMSMPQAVLGVAFSLGIPMAFCAAAGPDVGAGEWLRRVPPAGWLLIAGNWAWVLAYDTEYAMVDRDDDLRIGLKTSAITLGRFDVVAVMASYVTFLVLWTVASRTSHANAAGPLYVTGLALALAQVIWHWRLIRERSREGCFKAFRLNHWLGFALFAGIALQLAAG